MSTGQRILKNSVFLTTSQVIAKVINFGLILVLTRYLTKDSFGLYSFSFAYVSVFFFITHMGIINLLVRDIAKNKESANEYIAHTLPVVLILSFGFLILVNLVPLILQWNSNERLITLAFSFYFLFDSLGRYFLAVMRAFERMGFEALLFVSERVLLMITALLSWYYDLPMHILVFIFVGIMGIKAFISLIIVTKNFAQSVIMLVRLTCKPILKEAYPFALITLFATVSARIDIVILKAFHSTDAVATYSTARKIIEALSFIPENIYNAVFPSLSLFYLAQKEKFNHTFKLSFLAITILAIPLSAGLLIFAPRIIALLFKPEYYDAFIPLRWLSLALLVFFMRQALSVTLNTTGNQHIFAIILGITMLVNITMNFLLIPKYDILGASLAALISEIFLILCILPFVQKQIDFKWSKLVLPKLAIAAILMYFIYYLVRDENFIVILIITIIAYPALLAILKLFSLSEIKQYVGILFKNDINNSK